MNTEMKASDPSTRSQPSMAAQIEADPETRELLEVIQAHGGVISPTQMCRHRRKWKDSEANELALRRLVRAGYGELGFDPPGPKGGRPAFRFRLFGTQCPDQGG